MKELFNAFDADNSGAVDFDEFLEKLRVSLTLYHDISANLVKLMT